MRRRLIISRHAADEMRKDGIRLADVKLVMEHEQVIETYSDDVPYPSRLVLGWPRRKAVHIVAADIPSSHETVIITVYRPDPLLWEHGFRRRKRQ